MADGPISDGGTLTLAVKRYVSSQFQNPTIKLSTEVSSKLGYAPTVQFKAHSHLTVLIEVSETPYPAILKLRRTEIEELQIPIAVYCACPEEAYTRNQKDSKQLIEHGFGLLTVASSGVVQRRAPGIPLIQRIAPAEFRSSIAQLPVRLRRKLAESYDVYGSNPASGVSGVTEIVEGLILTAGREAVGKGWIASAKVKPGQPAVTLAAMEANGQFNGATAAIGSVKGYISEIRNNSHHFPKNPASAAKKYRECRHSFLEGLKRVAAFRSAMRNAGLTGGLK